MGARLGSVGGALAAGLTVALVQLGAASYYWIPDARAATILAPTWDAVLLVLLVVGWSRLTELPRWSEPAIRAALTLAIGLVFAVAVGQGFLQREFGRELLLALDIKYVAALFKMVQDSESPRVYLGSMALVVATPIGLGVALYGGIGRLRRFVAVHPRRQVAFALAALGYLVIGRVTVGVHAPVAREVGRQLALAWNLKAPLAASARRLEIEATTRFPRADALLTAAAPPTHVYLFIVESYGQALFAEPAPAAFVRFPGFLDEQAATLARAGYSARSRYLRSPVFGGGSWMAESSLLCGVSLHNQKRYVSLFESAVRCWPRLWRAAGYRAVFAAPNTKQHEAALENTLGFDISYFKPDFKYAGPPFGWSYMPDQFTIDFIHRREVARMGTRPLLVVYALTSSHVPWGVTPPLVDWERIGDGSVYQSVPVLTYDNGLLHGEHYRDGYQASIEYSLASIVSYATRLPADDRSLIVILGDHQPRQPIADQWRDRRWVPVHVLSRDAMLVARLERAGYGPGLVPAAGSDGREPPGLERLIGDLLAALATEAP